MSGTDWLDQLEQKAAAATAGEWVASINIFGDRADVRVKGEWGPQAGITYSVPRTADAEFIAAANPTVVQTLIDELRKAKGACRTLGKIVEDQCRDALNATGLHHLIDEDGDGDWGAVWENLAGIAAERDRARVKAWDEGCLAGMEWQQVGPSGVPHDPPSNPYRATSRAALNGGSDQ